MRTPSAASPLLAAMLLVCSVALSSGAAADNCAALGFGDSLLCSDCSRLESLVPDAALAAECRGCCSSAAAESAAPYEAAVLKICS